MRPWLLSLAAIIAFVATPWGAEARPILIGIAGDSTVATYPDDIVQKGWGQYIQSYFDDGVVVDNLAKGGRSTKTFLNEGLWSQLMGLKPDIVLIQFGHNDSHSPDHPEHTDPQGDYKAILTRFVAEARAAGADPVLITPVQRRTTADGLIPYAEAMKEVATGHQVKLIDLHARSGDLYARLGPAGTAALEKPDDRTHFNAEGARQIARLVLHDLLLAEPQLRAHLKAQEVGANRDAPALPPNILFILADDMGRGDISAYNAQSAWRTPHIDRLAQAGMVFNDAHSSSAVCSPSRYSILTGRYSWRSTLKEGVGSGFSAPIIEANRLTVAGLLRQHGYSTAMIGKWHLGLSWANSNPAAIARDQDPTDGESALRGPGPQPSPGAYVDYLKPFGGGPLAHGFDSFLGISASLDMPPYVWLRDDHAVSPPTHKIKASKLPAMWRTGPESDDFAHVDVLPKLTDEAVAYLAKQEGKKPFFLYLALTAPHTPIVPTKEFRGSTHTTPYGDFCSQVDAAVGRVLEALAADRLDRNTLVIFTADNGCSPSADFPELKKFHHDPQMGLRGEKADIYEGGHRIPFMARWPGHISAGRRSDQVICQIDFMATCAALLSSPLPADAGEDSYSLLPVLYALDDRTPIREATVHHSINGSFAIRQGDWKLCLCPDSGGWSDPKPGHAPPGSPPFQLFNLAKDPAETTNVSAENPEIVRRLGLLLKSYVRNGRSTPGAPQRNTGRASWPQLAWMSQFNN